MKVLTRSLILAAACALSAGAALSPPARAQQRLAAVELAQPIGAELIEESEQPPATLEPAPAAQASISDESTDDADAAEQFDVVPQPLPATDAEGATADDPPIEVVKERYPNGVVRVEREVTQDAEGNYIPHGLWRQFDPTGRLIAEGRYVESRKEGIWRRLYRGDDAPLLATAPYHSFTPPFVSQATFLRGQLHGKWTVSDAKQRKIHEIEFVEGERHGPATWFYPSGQGMLLAQYDHGLASGELLQYGPDSQLLAKET